MTTFLARGLLNPPSGVEDFLSGGTISRAVEESVALSVSLLSYTEADVDITGTNRWEDGKTPGFQIEVTAVGAHTGVTVVARIPIMNTTVAGMTLGDLSLGDLATQWGADSVTSNGSGTSAYYEATWTLGSMTDETQYIDCRVGTIGPVIWGTWNFGSTGPYGTYYATNGLGQLAASSNEATATTDTDAFDAAATDIECDLSTNVSTITEDEEFTFTVRQSSFGLSGHYTNSVTIQITDAVICSEPTVSVNTDGWSVGSWTSPGGGVQWQCIISFAGTINAGTAKEITFATTPADPGTWGANVSATGVENAVTVADTDAATVTVEGGITWTVDATSGGNVPANATEWADFISYYSLSVAVPDYLHLCQEASGNLADSIGSLTLTANGSPAYNQTLSGWSRTGVKGNASTANQRFYSGSGPNPSTTSVARLILAAFGSLDASAREVMSNGNASDLSVQAYNGSSVNRLRYRESSNIVDTSTGNDYTSPGPVAVVLDHTGSRARLYTALETLSPTFGAGANDAGYVIGARSGTWADSTIGYECGWSGSNAEISDANMGALFTALNW